MSCMLVLLPEFRAWGLLQQVLVGPVKTNPFQIAHVTSCILASIRALVVDSFCSR